MKRIYYEYDPDTGASVAVYSPRDPELPYLVSLKRTQAGQTKWIAISEYRSQADIIRQAIRQFDNLFPVNKLGQG